MKNQRNFLIVIVACFGLLYCSISLVNHYLFRTFAWDLGINNNAIFDYTYFRVNDCMLMQPQFKNLLSDHFSLLIIPISFFRFIFGTYTLLIFQVILILAGGIGVYKYFRFKDPVSTLPLWATFHFFSIWGIYSALGFDYHDNVASAMLVPWFLLNFEKKNLKTSLLILVCVLLGKENMALWCAFICLGLALIHFRDRQLLKASLGMMVFSGVYFLVVIKFIMPSLANEGREYLHFKYSALGSGFGEAISTLIRNPAILFELLFKNHLNDPIAWGIKKELHYFIFLSGGFLLLFKPQYLVMLIPIYAQKLFNDDIGKWGLNYQYSIEFVPILAVGAFNVIFKMKPRFKTAFCVVVPVLTFFTTIRSLDHRVSKYYVADNNRFYSVRHYRRDFDVKTVYEAIDAVPSQAKLSAQSPIVPHVSFRDYIYQFPVIENAEYILLNKSENPYPLTQEEFSGKIKELSESPEWEIIFSKENVLVYRKKINR